MTVPIHSRRIRTALRVAVAPLLSLALASCTSNVEPEEEMLDIEALQSALDEAHAAHNDQGEETLDDIEAAARRQIRTEVSRGALSGEEARRLSRTISGMKARFEGAVESGRLTLEDACAHFREAIVRLFEELRAERERRRREGRG